MAKIEAAVQKSLEDKQRLAEEMERLGQEAEDQLQEQKDKLNTLTQQESRSSNGMFSVLYDQFHDFPPFLMCSTTSQSHELTR
jgi:hypothetical protein